MPERSSPPMITRFAEASAAASVIMKTGRNAPAAATSGAVHPAMSSHATPPTEQPATNATNPPQAPQRLSPEVLGLLEKQNALVSGPWDDAVDAQYEEISRRLRELAEEGAAQ
jgi:hypothetical protein